MNRKRLFPLLVVLALISTAGAQELTGSWQGALEVMGAKLRLVFHFEKSDSGWTALLDSPDQGAKGIPCGQVRTPADSLIVEVPVVHGSYLALYSPDSLRYDGVWRQGGLELPLQLVKSDQPVQMNRPQEPRPPFPYRSEEVTIPNKRAGLTLAGTLTLPEGEGRHPAVILITGSGAQNRDEAIMGHRPFWVIADHLSRSGFAVLRCDDRGTGASTGDIASATSLDFAGDVAAQVDALIRRPDIDKKRIILAGHSEGGLIAPMVAAKNKKIAGIILLAGPGVTGEKIMLAQGELIGRAAGQDEATVKQNRHIQEILFAIMKEGGEGLEEKLRAAMTAQRSEMSASEQAAMTDQLINMQIKQLASPWFRFFLTHDPAPVLRKVKCPVLALNGELDLQVPADENLAAIASALHAGGNKRFETHKLYGLNHLFQTAKTGGVDEYSRIEETFSPRALELMTNWLARDFYTLMP